LSYPDDKILKWAFLRGLMGTDTTQEKRVAKLLEEFGELSGAMLRNDRKKMMDALGDMHVVMVQIAHSERTSLEDCVFMAYREIKDRTGKLVNGTFIKEGE
jgi:NTP pyrophosphatase (non-canonical NTP hydrolase)